jgi:hypothetical protein
MASCHSDEDINVDDETNLEATTTMEIADEPQEDGECLEEDIAPAPSSAFDGAAIDDEQETETCQPECIEESIVAEPEDGAREADDYMAEPCIESLDSEGREVAEQIRVATEEVPLEFDDEYCETDLELECRLLSDHAKEITFVLMW